MKKIIAISMLGMLPALALASGGHDDMRSGHHTERGAEHMGGMTPHEHAAEAETETDRPDDPDRVDRTIEVTIKDTMRF